MKKIIKEIFGLIGLTVVRERFPKKFEKIYAEFEDSTMIPKNIYCGNLKIVASFIPKVEGDVIECGVWRGGMIAGISRLVGNARKYYLFDSFEGLPEARGIDGESALKWQQNTSGYNYHDNCKAEIGFAKKAMDKTNTEYYLFKGWFSDTLPGFKSTHPIALLRLDADWYDSTMDCLKNLFQYVNFGGIIILDDYYTWDGCSRAVHDFLSSIKSASRVSTSSDGICYIIKQDQYFPI